MIVLPCGVHFKSYRGERAYFHTKPQWVAFLLFMSFLMVLPQFFGKQYISFINILCIYIIATVGLQIITGFAGQINLGQSAFMGVGAYTVGCLSNTMPFYLAIPLGGLSAALMGSIFAIPAMRIKGLYFALTTLAAQVLFPIFIMSLPRKWFGGAYGLTVECPTIWNLRIEGETQLYYFILFHIIIMLYFAFNLQRTKAGREIKVVRDNDIVAEIIGYNIFHCKLKAFCIGAFYAGVSGGLWAYYVRYITTDQFTLYNSIWLLGMVVIGGGGNILGGIIGTFLLRGVHELTINITPALAERFANLGGAEFWFSVINIFVGAIIIFFMVFEPRGLFHRWDILKFSFRIWPFPHL